MPLFFDLREKFFSARRADPVGEGAAFGEGPAIVGAGAEYAAAPGADGASGR